jgi:nicotinamidase-related amidase
MEKGWEAFLTERDKQHLAQSPFGNRPPRGFGERPAIIVVDDYYGSVGTERQPLLESIKTWPASCGEEGWEAIDKTVVLLEAARAAAVPIIYLHGLDGFGHPRMSPEMAAKSNEIVAEIAPQPGDIVIQKMAASGFHGTPILFHLHQLRIDTLIVVGESTSGCVRATVVDAATERFSVSVVGECCFDRTEMSHWVNLFDMNTKYADVIDVETAVKYFASLPTFAAEATA